MDNTISSFTIKNETNQIPRQKSSSTAPKTQSTAFEELIIESSRKNNAKGSVKDQGPQTRQTPALDRVIRTPIPNKVRQMMPPPKQVEQSAPRQDKRIISDQGKQPPVVDQTRQTTMPAQTKQTTFTEPGEKIVETIQNKKAIIDEQAKQGAVVTQDKETAMREQTRQATIKTQVKDTAAGQIKQTAPEQAKQPPVFIGQINKDNPTVSQLMVHNDQFGDKSWKIIHSPINRNKPYTRLREGTKVFLDPTSNELFLRGKQDMAEGVSLGTLNKKTPTISHLLAASEFDKEKWQILSLPVNADKDFRHIPAGTEVRIDPLTKEISWGKASSRFGLQPDFSSPASTKETPLMSNRLKFAPQEKTEDLSAAVQKFIGTPYSKMDCYGMVVKGLENIGVQYTGKEGLYRRLTDMAKEKGLPANAYLTGEGLVEAAGSKVLYETFSSVEKPGLAARQTLEKMSNLLEKGQILSFSTPTRGHTGVISKHNDGEWTFINSGQMDHPINKAQTRKGVGEEALLAELTNWFELASKRKESLTVTLGKVDLAKLQRQHPEPSGTLLASI